MDPELDAMSKVADAIGALERDSQGRVIRWAVERFNLTVPGSAKGPNAARKQPNTVPDDDDTPEVYQHFAELHDEFAPTSDAERALVCGYWIQVVGAEPSFQSAQLNRELKNLGHEVDNITRALQSNIDEKPALVLQIRKSGGTRQARKTYKLSVAGIKVVEARLEGESSEE